MALAVALTACYGPSLTGPSADAPEALADATVDAGSDAPVCAQTTSCDAFPIGEDCFYVCGRTASVDFAEALDSCSTQLGGCLAMLTGTQSDALGPRLLSAAITEDLWIGLTQPAGGDAGPAEDWRWVCDGTPLDPGDERWAVGEPNDGGTGEDCVVMNATLGWNDRPSSDRHPFVCLAD